MKQVLDVFSRAQFLHQPRRRLSCTSGGSGGIIRAVPGHTSILELQPRDREILETLTRRVCVLSIRQIARTWWSESHQAERRAWRRVRQLERDGWVEVIRAMAHPELPLQHPHTIWYPGKAPANFGKLAGRLQERWNQPEVSTPCVVGTEQAGAAFSGHGGRAPQDSEVTHDVHLAAVYLLMRRELPTRAASWVGEAALPVGQGIKVPDALVCDGRQRTAIEFGGSYDHVKLSDFHGYCESQGRGYELW